MGKTANDTHQRFLRDNLMRALAPRGLEPRPDGEWITFGGGRAAVRGVLHDYQEQLKIIAELTILFRYNARKGNPVLIPFTLAADNNTLEEAMLDGITQWVTSVLPVLRAVFEIGDTSALNVVIGDYVTHNADPGRLTNQREWKLNFGPVLVRALPMPGTPEGAAQKLLDSMNPGTVFETMMDVFNEIVQGIPDSVDLVWFKVFMVRSLNGDVMGDIVVNNNNLPEEITKALAQRFEWPETDVLMQSFRQFIVLKRVRKNSRRDRHDRSSTSSRAHARHHRSGPRPPAP